MSNPIGALVGLKAKGPDFGPLLAAGLRCCQLCTWEMQLWTAEMAERVRRERERLGIEVTALWAGWPGPRVWNFIEGPATLGLVPPRYRAERVAALKQAADFAHAIGLPAIITHLGFIPEHPGDEQFEPVVQVVREIALYCRERGLEFWFETGQETPVALLRLIQAVDTGNLGINLDPANLILYGKGNPVDSLDVYGQYVRNLHAKDGLYPTDPMRLGREVEVGTGRVNFPELVRGLRRVGFRGAYIIEREIAGGDAAAALARTIAYLRRVLEEQQEPSQA